MIELDKNFDFKGKTKEIVENMKKENEVKKNNGEISEEQFSILLTRLDMIIDKFDLSEEDRYKKAYEKKQVVECVMAMLDIYEKHGKNFRKAFVVSNCFLNPLGYSYSAKDSELFVRIFACAYSFVKKENNESKYEVFLKELEEIFILEELLYKTNQYNIQRLKSNAFSKYSLSEQLRIFCIFLQDQDRLMQKIMFKSEKKATYMTGIEQADVYFESQKLSFRDHYECILECLDILAKYSYVTKKKELDKNTEFRHGDIHHLNIPSMKELMLISQQRFLILKMEEKFRYSNWNISIQKYGDEKKYIFKASNKEKFKAHIVGSHRRQYRAITSIIMNSEMLEEPSGINAIDQLAKQMNVFEPDFKSIDKSLYNSSKAYTRATIEAFKSLTKRFYLECEFDSIRVKDIITTYEFLYIIAKVYMTSVLQIFNETDYTNYKYLVPIIKTDDIVCSMANLYKFDLAYSRKLIECFIFDDGICKDGDVFTRPLIYIGNDSILFCETLITQINIERSLEMLFAKYQVNLAPMGKEFEREMLSKLSTVPDIKVNTNKIEFQAYDGKDVEFDFLAIFEDHLLLIEFKSILTPYSDKQLYKSEHTIKEGVEQVLRRCRIIQKDWCKIKKLCNVDLPELPFEDNKIIKIVCTNIFDFTTLVYDGVIITDESVLLKYFIDPHSGGYSKTEESILIWQRELWANNKPNINEFKKYLIKPFAVSYLDAAIQEEFRPIPRFEEQEGMGFIDFAFKEESLKKEYPKFIKQNKYMNFKTHFKRNKNAANTVKIGRNDPCTCGSGKKHKKCCGNSL